jgi:hypothetical protein
LFYYTTNSHNWIAYMQTNNFLNKLCHRKKELWSYWLLSCTFVFVFGVMTWYSVSIHLSHVLYSLATGSEIFASVDFYKWLWCLINGITIPSPWTTSPMGFLFLLLGLNRLNKGVIHCSITQPTAITELLTCRPIIS